MSDPHDEAHIAALNKVLGSASPPPAGDLVERLRNMASAWKRWDADGIFRGALHSDIVNEAASEIARLRQKLEEAERSGPGSPRARLEYLLDELERLFPDAHKRIMSDLGEPKYVAAIESLQAALTLAQSQRDALAKAAGNFIAKLAECQPHIDSAFVMEYMHGRAYTGPNYADELAALASARAQAVGE